MAELYNKQAKIYAKARPSYPSELYAKARPSYPSELFQFIASKTPKHDLAWDVGTGSGQAAVPLAGIYKKVVATDTSLEQLSFAHKLPNIHYEHTPSNMSISDVERVVSSQADVDLVTVATAVHWFDRASFYQHVNRVLQQPGGVFAVWCYTEPLVNESVDAIYSRLFYIDSESFWGPGRGLVDNEYRDLDFPFEPVEGEDHTGPFRFESKIPMNLDGYLSYIRSWSAYQRARDKGVELLTEEVLGDLARAWGEDAGNVKTVIFPVHLRIGRVAS